MPPPLPDISLPLTSHFRKRIIDARLEDPNGFTPHGQGRMPSYKTCFLVQWYRLGCVPVVLVVTEDGEARGNTCEDIRIERKFPGKVFFTDIRGPVEISIQALLSDNTCGVVKGGNVYFVRRVLLDLDADKSAEQLEKELLAKQEKYRNVEQLKYDQDQYTNGQVVPAGFLSTFTEEQDKAGADECTDIRKLASRTGAKMVTAETRAATERERRRESALEARLAGSQLLLDGQENPRPVAAAAAAAPPKRRIHPALAARQVPTNNNVVDYNPGEFDNHPPPPPPSAVPGSSGGFQGRRSAQRAVIEDDEQDEYV